MVLIHRRASASLRTPGAMRWRHRSIALCARTLVLVAAAAGLSGASPRLLAADEADLWQALRSGRHVALLRHARAPGTGDPPEFTPGECSTQRNLSDAGRAQAMRIGARLRENGIGSARVYSSQWCRCLDTARLLGVGPVAELPFLNSFFQQDTRRDAQTQALAAWISGHELDEPALLVTHQVNITALTGVYPAEGTMVVVRASQDGDIEVVGTIATQ